MIFVSAGYNFCHNRDFNIVRPQGTDEYLLLIIRSPAWFGQGEERRKIEPNSLILFRKKTPQYFGAAEDIFINDWLSFDMSPEEERAFRNTVLFDRLIQSEEAAECSEIIKLMQTELYSSAVDKEEILQLYFQILRKKLEKIFGSSQVHKLYYTKLLTVRTGIYNAPHLRRSVKAMAEELCISESYFLHLYKAYFGVSPVADEIHSRVEYSKQLLSASNYSVKEIAEMLRYSSDTQYMKQFKAVTHMTPSAYRRELTRNKDKTEKAE